MHYGNFLLKKEQVSPVVMNDAGGTCSFFDRKIFIYPSIGDGLLSENMVMRKLAS